MIAGIAIMGVFLSKKTASDEEKKQNTAVGVGGGLGSIIFGILMVLLAKFVIPIMMKSKAFSAVAGVETVVDMI